MTRPRSQSWLGKDLGGDGSLCPYCSCCFKVNETSPWLCIKMCFSQSLEAEREIILLRCPKWRQCVSEERHPSEPILLTFRGLGVEGTDTPASWILPLPPHLPFPHGLFGFLLPEMLCHFSSGEGTGWGLGPVQVRVGIITKLFRTLSSLLVLEEV